MADYYTTSPYSATLSGSWYLGPVQLTLDGGSMHIQLTQLPDGLLAVDQTVSGAADWQAAGTEVATISALRAWYPSAAFPARASRAALSALLACSSRASRSTHYPAPCALAATASFTKLARATHRS